MAGSMADGGMGCRAPPRSVGACCRTSARPPDDSSIDSEDGSGDCGGGGGGDCQDSCGTSGDPTSGGDPGNSGGDCDADNDYCGDPQPADPNASDPNTNNDPNNPSNCTLNPSNNVLCGGLTSVTMCNDGGCMNFTQDIVTADADVPLSQDAITILGGAYDRVPFADILTYNARFSPTTCGVGGLILGGLAVATAVNPGIFEVTGPTGSVIAIILAVGCDW
jgi:hypothetical protein